MCGHDDRPLPYLRERAPLANEKAAQCEHRTLVIHRRYNHKVTKSGVTTPRALLFFQPARMSIVILGTPLDIPMIPGGTSSPPYAWMSIDADLAGGSTKANVKSSIMRTRFLCGPPRRLATSAEAAPDAWLVLRAAAIQGRLLNNSHAGCATAATHASASIHARPATTPSGRCCFNVNMLRVRTITRRPAPSTAMASSPCLRSTTTVQAFPASSGAARQKAR